MEECLDGQEQWECTENLCLQHIIEKKNTKYQPKED